MLLNQPIMITPRLMAGVQIGASYISIGYCGDDTDRRTIYRYCLDLEGCDEYESTDLKSGCQGGSLQEGLASLLGFMSACGESLNYSGGENANLFPPKIAAWCAENSDELTMLELEIEESEGLIVE